MNFYEEIPSNVPILAIAMRIFRMPGRKKASKAKALQTTGHKEKPLRVSARRLTQSDQFRELYTVGQLADLLQLNEMTIYRMVNRGDLPSLTIGRMKRFRRGEIEEFLGQCRVSATFEPEGGGRKSHRDRN